MHEPQIVVRTAWGPEFGMGHIQRMASLAWHLRTKYGQQTAVWIDEPTTFLPQSLPIHTGENPPKETALLIRDMRDSTTGEIESLKRIAPVVALDDMGAGSRIADCSIDLLPVPAEYSEPRAPVREDLFLFGYNFLRHLEAQGAVEIDKSIDILLYAGTEADIKFVEQVLALVPDERSCAVFSGDSAFLSENGARTALERSDYVPTLLAARLVITHFGITMYEANAAGCAIVAINPTEYHARLCELAPKRFALKNLGVRDTLEPRRVRAVIAEALEGSRGMRVRPADVYRGAYENLERFSQIVIGMIRK
jgi:hypothetical protein